MYEAEELVVKLFQQGCEYATYKGRKIIKFYNAIEINKDSEFLIRWAEWNEPTWYSAAGWLYKYGVVQAIPDGCELIGVISP